MNNLTAQERLALTLDELDDVERARAPGLARLSNDEREELARRLRKHLDRARTGGGGVSFSSADRLPIKIATLERALSECGGQVRDEASEQRRIAERALELKNGSKPAPHPDPGDTANTGPVPHPNVDAATAAMSAEAQRTVLERTRKVR